MIRPTMLAALLLALAACQSETAGEAGAPRATAAAFDFIPPEDLAARLPPVGRITPLTGYAAALSARLTPTERRRTCNWVAEERFPPPQRALVSHASRAAFKGAGRHMPHEGNRDFRQGAFYAKRAAASIMADAASPARPAFEAALVANAEAGAGLDLSKLVDPALGRPVATPDSALAIEDSTAWAVSYMLVADRLTLDDAQRRVVEGWLDALLANFVDNYPRWHDATELRSSWLVAHGEMVRAILRRDPAAFDRAARRAVDFVAHTRADGSHRFGAARGYRAVFYQGVALSTSIETMLLLESQGLPGAAILGPTILRMADFWSRAYDDPSVIHPYARENVAVGDGSDWRRQERVEIAWAIDMAVALAAAGPLRDRLARIQSQKRFPSIYSTNFNMACVAAGYA